MSYRHLTILLCVAGLILGCAGPTESRKLGQLDAIPSWSIQYEGEIVRRGKDFHIVDLFDVTDDDLDALHRDGTRAIAYFSSQFEDWRHDIDFFPPEAIGEPLGKWPGEHWVDTGHEAIRRVMINRLELARERGFYGVDIDNVDFFEHETGFETSREAALEFIRFLSREARKRGLKFGLKNAPSLIEALKAEVDFYVNEEGHQYNEIYYYQGLNKPVLNIEYEPIRQGTPGIYTLLKPGGRMEGEEVVISSTPSP